MRSTTLLKTVAWIEALAVTIVGAVLVSVRSVSVDVLVSEGVGSQATYETSTVSVLEIGLVLLAVGLLILAALLIVEAYRGPSREDRAPRLEEIPAPSPEVGRK